MDAQGQPLEINSEWWIFYIWYKYFTLLLFQKGLRTNLNAYNSYLICNISWTDSDSSPILQYNIRTAPLFFNRRGLRQPPLSSGRTTVGTFFQTE